MLKFTKLKSLLTGLLSLASVSVYSQSNCSSSVYVLQNGGYAYDFQFCEGSMVQLQADLYNFSSVQHYQWYIGDEPIGTNDATLSYKVKLSDSGKKFSLKLDATSACINSDFITINKQWNAYKSVQVIDKSNPPALDLYPKFFCKEGNNVFSLPLTYSDDYSKFKWFQNGQEVNYAQNLTKTDNVQLKYKVDGCPGDFYLESNIAYYNPDCELKGEMVENSLPIVTGEVINDNVANYKRGRENENTTCNTGKTNENVIDIFYKFSYGWNVYYNGFEMEIQLADPSYEVSLEFVDSVGKSMVCLENISTDLNTKTFRIEPKTLDQWLYNVRLEIGADSPLGHARVQATNGAFSVKASSTITALEDNSIANTKKVAKIYNLLGMEVGADYKGLVIYQYTDGSTSKKMVE